jgi:uncharacterized membrane protein HdeD (DUF308 family)
MSLQGPAAVVRQVSTFSILWGILLIALGMLAIASPLIAAIAANVVLAWLLIVAGVVHFVIAFHTREAGSMLWRLLVGLAYVGFGAYLLARPAVGVASLTLVLASLFLVEGFLDIVLFFKARGIRGSSWFLFDGIITLLLGLMIYAQWPSSSAWAIGTLVGVSLIISGVTRLMLASTVRKAASVLPMAA